MKDSLILNGNWTRPIQRTYCRDFVFQCPVYATNTAEPTVLVIAQFNLDLFIAHLPVAERMGFDTCLNYVLWSDLKPWTRYHYMQAIPGHDPLTSQHQHFWVYTGHLEAMWDTVITNVLVSRQLFPATCFSLASTSVTNLAPDLHWAVK